MSGTSSSTTAIHSGVVATGNWFVSRRELLIAPKQVTQVDWSTQQVAVHLPEDAIAASPVPDSLAEHTGARG